MPSSIIIERHRTSASESKRGMPSSCDSHVWVRVRGPRGTSVTPRNRCSMLEIGLQCRVAQIHTEIDRQTHDRTASGTKCRGRPRGTPTNECRLPPCECSGMPGEVAEKTAGASRRCSTPHSRRPRTLRSWMSTRLATGRRRFSPIPRIGLQKRVRVCLSSAGWRCVRGQQRGGTTALGSGVFGGWL